MSYSTKSKIMVPIPIAVFLLDRLTKSLVLSNMEVGDSIPVVGGYFELTHVHNTGAAFGIGSMMNEAYRVPFFAGAAIVILGLMILFARMVQDTDRPLLVGLALCMGGALGNLTDRLIYGHVIDFIDWHVGMRHWPAFNVADSALTVGIVLFCYWIMFGKGPKEDEGEGAVEG